MLTKKDVFDTIVGAALAFGCMYAGYYAGRKKAEWDEKSIYRRINRLESDACILKQRMNHLEWSDEEKALE